MRNVVDRNNNLHNELDKLAVMFNKYRGLGSSETYGGKSVP